VEQPARKDEAPRPRLAAFQLPALQLGLYPVPGVAVDDAWVRLPPHGGLAVVLRRRGALDFLHFPTDDAVITPPGLGPIAQVADVMRVGEQAAHLPRGPAGSLRKALGAAARAGNAALVQLLAERANARLQFGVLREQPADHFQRLRVLRGDQGNFPAALQ